MRRAARILAVLAALSAASPAPAQSAPPARTQPLHVRWIARLRVRPGADRSSIVLEVLYDVTGNSKGVYGTPWVVRAGFTMGF